MIAYIAVSSGAHSLIPLAVVVALITSGATLVIGSLNLRSQKETFKWQRDHSAKQIDLMQSVQFTERFMRTINQLNDKNERIRIGAVFVLERLARESPPDRPQIVIILASVVRERLPVQAMKTSEYVVPLTARAPDAQAALTVLCRPPLSDGHARRPEFGRLDLSRTDLRRASLRNADLHGASLWGSHLEFADLRGADLTDSNLGDAYFGSIDANQGYRLGTDLRHAKLTGAELTGAHDFDVALTEGAIGLTAF
jgi:hypothetical protein